MILSHIKNRSWSNLKPDRKRLFSLRGLVILVVILSIFATSMLVVTQKAQAALLSAAQVQMGDPRPGQTGVTYTIKFTFPSTSTIKCIQVLYGDTVADIGTVAPSGMTNGTGGSLSGGGLTAGNWTFYGGATAGTDMQFENSAGEASTATTVTLTVTTVTNTSSSAFYAQAKTFSGLTTHTCSGAVDSSNTMALQTQGGVLVTATVNPSLTFTLAGYSGSAVNGSSVPNPISTGSSVAYGILSPGVASTAAQLATVSTNAANGYFLYIRSTQTFNDGNGHTLTDTTGTNGSPSSFSGSSSTSGWGYITDNSQETQFTSNTWAKFTTTNAEVAKSTTPISGDATHLAYQVEASNTQQPGDYSTTITYTATPSY